MDKPKSFYDLVHDARLETELKETYTEHIIYQPGHSASQRRVERKERWVRDRAAPVLGRGAYGVVYRESCDGRIRAVKEIRKQVVIDEELDYMRELEAIFKFSHPRYAHCFVRSDGWFENSESLYISMEFIENGDLQRYLTRPFRELEAKQIVSQIREGLEFMHDNGFVHRDLKPGNIMVAKPRPNWVVKITDFGISKRRQQDTTTFLTQQRGTIAYCAPEVFGFVQDESQGSCTFAVDMWSLGVVAFCVLGNSIPFKTCGELCKYGMGVSSLPLEILGQNGVSYEGQDFVQKLLLTSPKARLSTNDAALHPWLSSVILLDPSDTQTISDIGDKFITRTSVSSCHEPSASWTTPDPTVMAQAPGISQKISIDCLTMEPTHPMPHNEDIKPAVPVIETTRSPNIQPASPSEGALPEATVNEKPVGNESIPHAEPINEVHLGTGHSPPTPATKYQPRSIEDRPEDSVNSWDVHRAGPPPNMGSLDDEWSGFEDNDSSIKAAESTESSYPELNKSAVRMPTSTQIPADRFESYGTRHHTPSTPDRNLMKIRYAPTFQPSDIQFANLPHRPAK